MVCHLVWDQDFESSILSQPTSIWGHSSAGRAVALQAIGPEFDPPWLHQIFMKEDIMIVTPLKKKVLVAENRTEAVSTGGIIVEGAASVRQSKSATVLAIGKDVTLVKPGDVVYLEWTKGQIVTIDDCQRVMIDEDWIVAVAE